MLKDKRFVYSFKGYIVNIDHIVTLRGGELVLDNNEIIPLSRKYEEEVRKSLINTVISDVGSIRGYRVSYLVLIFISAIMDAVTVKVYVEKWLGKPTLRISTIAYWGIFILTELASRGGQLFMIDVSQEKAMVSQVSAHIVIMLVFICLYDSRIAECISAFIIWVLGYLVSIGLSDVVVITTDQMLYDGGITHLISVMDMYAQFIIFACPDHNTGSEKLCIR